MNEQEPFKVAVSRIIKALDLDNTEYAFVVGAINKAHDKAHLEYRTSNESKGKKAMALLARYLMEVVTADQLEYVYDRIAGHFGTHYKDGKIENKTIRQVGLDIYDRALSVVRRKQLSQSLPVSTIAFDNNFVESGEEVSL